MRLAADGARALASSNNILPSSSRLPHARLIEIGVIIAYCRPFSGPPRPGAKPRTEIDELAPKDSELHKVIFEARSKLFAHTDDDYKFRREARDPLATHSHSEEYSDLDREFLESLARLAETNGHRFWNAIREREQVLVEADVPPEPYL